MESSADDVRWTVRRFASFEMCPADLLRLRLVDISRVTWCLEFSADDVCSNVRWERAKADGVRSGVRRFASVFGLQNLSTITAIVYGQKTKEKGKRDLAHGHKRASTQGKETYYHWLT